MGRSVKEPIFQDEQVGVWYEIYGGALLPRAMAPDAAAHQGAPHAPRL